MLGADVACRGKESCPVCVGRPSNRRMTLPKPHQSGEVVICDCTDRFGEPFPPHFNIEHMSDIHHLDLRRALSALVAMGVVLSALTAVSAPAAETDELAWFEAKIRPLLVERCLECHG